MTGKMVKLRHKGRGVFGEGVEGHNLKMLGRVKVPPTTFTPGNGQNTNCIRTK